MKMIKLLLAFLIGILLFSAPLHWANSASNDPVNIPDANLRATIETALGKAPGDQIVSNALMIFDKVGQK